MTHTTEIRLYLISQPSYSVGAVALALFLCSLAGALPAQNGPPKPTDTQDKATAKKGAGKKKKEKEVTNAEFAEALNNFGRLPVFFNGRVTDYSNVAKAYAERLTAVKSFEFTNPITGRPTTTIEWFLDVAANHDRKWKYKVLRIPKPIRDEIQLSDSKSGRYSVLEVAPHFKAIDEKAQQQQADPKRRAELQLAAAKVSHQIATLQEILASHMTDTRQSLLQQRMQYLSRTNIPLVIPPTEKEFRWKSLLIGQMEESTRQQRHPEVKLIRNIIAARQSNQRAEFVDAVNAYTLFLGGRKYRSPLAFKTPPAWRELGNRSAPTLDYFGDVVGFGMPVASFQSRKHLNCNGGVACVRNPRATIEQIINHHRFMAGWLPLPKDKVKEEIKSTTINNLQATLYEVTDHPNLGGKRAATFAHMFAGGMSWTVSWYGPKEGVLEERAAFKSFADSLTIDVAQQRQLLDFLPSNTLPYKDLVNCVYIVMGGNQTLVLQLYTRARPRKLMQKQLEDALAKLKLPAPPSPKPLVDRLEWDMPKNWIRARDDIIILDQETTQLELRLFEGKADGHVQEQILEVIKVMIQPLKVTEEKKTLNLGKLEANRWILTP